MVKPTIQNELQQLLETEPLREELEVMEYVCQDIRYTYDEESRRELPAVLRNNQDKEEITARFELLALLLQSADTVEELAAKVDETYLAEKERYEENMQTVFEQTKPFERTVRSLNLLYENATGDTNVYIMPVSNARFADSANPRHFDMFRHYLRQKFYAWFMENSPFYISYVGDIGSKSAMDKMAMIAQETRALAVLDIVEKSTAQAVMDYADRIKIAGIPPHLAHLVVLGTWLYVNNAWDVEFKRDEAGRLKRTEKPMSVPAASAFIGKLMSVPPGHFITGLEKSAILGIDGVKVQYDLERDEAKEWDKRGLIQIERYGHIQGATTANKSNNYDLRKFPKVDVANALLKDLVQYCNNKAYSKWGRKYRNDFKQEVEIYLNNRMKRELIEGYKINSIEYDQYEETVLIDITVKFFDVADEFEISLHGPKEMIKLMEQEAEAA